MNRKRKAMLRTITGILVLTVLVVGGLVWRASWAAHQLLRSWATATIHDQSSGVYEMVVGRVRLNLALRRVSVDSILVTTNRAINAARPRPLATVRLAFQGCTITGVEILALVRNYGLIADSFGCKTASVRFVVPPGTPKAASPPNPTGAVLALQHRMRLPAFAPLVHIAVVDFPDVALDFHVEHARGDDSRVQMERFRWRMAAFDMDPADAASASHPMFSRKIEWEAENLVFHPDSNTVLRVESLAGNLTDSTLDVFDFSVGPVLGRSAFARAKPYRRKYTTMRTARVEVRGADIGALLLGQGLRARTALVDSLLLDITNDHRLPVQPVGNDRHRTPQQWIADLDRPVNVDSVFLGHSKVVYRLRNSGRDDFGIITFARINAVALDVNTAPADSTRRAMRLAVTSYFQDSARLAAYFVVPLRAAHFDMTYRGTLGPMHAEHMNQFIQATTPIRISHGELTGIDFQGTVSHGRTLGTVTPRYNNFSFAVTQENSTGILGSSGYIGGVARKLASFAGNWKKIYALNPEDPRRKARVGTINHRFDADEALADYLWYGIRDGLITVMRR